MQLIQFYWNLVLKMFIFHILVINKIKIIKAMSVNIALGCDIISTKFFDNDMGIPLYILEVHKKRKVFHKNHN
jgi:hypothetical protein